MGNEPKKDFNAHDDFFSLVTTCHILVAAMDVLGMDSLDDDPSKCLIPDDILSLSKDQRSVILTQIANVIVRSFVNLQHNIEFVTNEGEKKKSGTSEDSTKDDSDTENSSGSDESGGDPNEIDDDNVQAYAKELLTLGLIYNEFSDGIREGDGERVIRCWRYLLLIFKAAQRTNYSCEAFVLLAQLKYILSPRLSQQLTWTRFVNTRGGAGHNIPCDLYIEHLNRVLKDGIKGLGANKTEKAITRLGKCIDALDGVLTNYDEVLQVRHSASFHTVASLDKDIKLMVNELSEHVKPFSCVKGRHHKNIKISKPLIKSLNSSKFHLWMNEKWNSLLAGLI